MLETFRKHHYVLMCLVAVVVIISFTFFFNPNTQQGRAGSGEVVRKIFDANLTQGDVDLIEQQKTVISQAGGGDTSVRNFLVTMHSIADESAPMDSRMADVDYSINVFLMRQECDRLGIAVEKEDVTKRITELEVFRTNGQFDGTRLKQFHTGGQHGDQSATEAKLYGAVRDLLLFERLGELIGGTYAPSEKEIDADFARANESVTVATALLAKKDYENQTISDEEIQKFYDAEKAKQDDEDKTTSPDPVILTDEQRTVKYCITEAPKSTAIAPNPPQPVPALPAKPDFSQLPEDEKKAKEEEWKKQEEEHKIKQEAYTKAQADYTKQMEAYSQKQKENEAEKRAWLQEVSNLSNALVADPAERGGATFEELAKPLEPPPAPAPVPATTVTPPVAIPAPAPAPSEEAPPPAPVPVPPSAETPPDASGATPAPAPDATPAPAETPANEKPKAVQGAQGPEGAEGQPSNATPPPAEAPPAPAEAAPAETPAPAPAETAPPAAPAETAPAPAPVPVPAAPTAPQSFVRTATFTKAAPPADIMAFTASGGASTVDLIFKAEKGDVESLIESQDKNSYLFFQVTGVVPAGVRPLEEVKTKISEKLKADKIEAALKAAAESARSNILAAMKEGKSFKEAAEANKAVATEYPAISAQSPLPDGTPNAAVIASTAGAPAGKDMPAQSNPNATQPGDVSEPVAVPGGLLLVHVVKKELQKLPDAEEQKRAMREKRTIRGVVSSLTRPEYNQQVGFEPYIAAMTEYRSRLPDLNYLQSSFGGSADPDVVINPVLKAWFAARRGEAQKASP
jgi:hypothetical protein